MKTNTIKGKLGYIAAVGVSIGLLFFVVCCTWIGFDVKNQCQEAKREYPAETDCVGALMTLVQDEGKSFRTRNSAIWALGQSGDKRALPVLEKYYTGVIPDREPLDKSLSQYELKKAIALVKGGFNMTAFVWRFGEK